MIFGYARVSTVGQELEIQLDDLKAAGCDVVFSEKVSGSKKANRPQLQALLDNLDHNPGSQVVITRMDRLARSASDLLTIIDHLTKHQCSLRILKQAIDTATPEGKLFITILAGFAEFETNLRRERQMEGINKRKAAGLYKGKQPQFDRQVVQALLANGGTVRTIARTLRCAESTAYRLIRESKQEQDNA